MKSITYIIIALLLSTGAEIFAQSNTNGETETLFGGDNVHTGGYGGVEVKSGIVNGLWGLFVGGKGGAIYNKVISLGAAGYALTSNHNINGFMVDGVQTPALLRTGYGGLYVEYINSSDKLIHITLNTLVGAGWAGITKPFNKINKHNSDEDSWVYENGVYFIVEPGVNIDMNITSFMRIGIGGSYRIVQGLDMPIIRDADLSGLTTSITFKFGKF